MVEARKYTTIIYEDTLEEKGRRRKFRSLAKKNNLHYAEVWCNPDYVLCLQNNLSRDRRVEEDQWNRIRDNFHEDNYYLMVNYDFQKITFEELVMLVKDKLEKSQAYFHNLDFQTSIPSTGEK